MSDQSTPTLTNAAHRLIAAAQELQKELAAPTESAPAAYTRDSFCKAHCISKSFYLKLRRAGLGPDELNLSTGEKRACPIITVEAAAEWRKRMAQRSLTGGR